MVCAGRSSGARASAVRGRRRTSRCALDHENFGPANLFPEVDSGCETSVYEEAIVLDNTDPLNVSSNTPIATEANLADATGANSVENARAHRALLRGDDLYVGYTYTENDALAQSKRPRANYNFWMRRFDAAAGTWASPKNLSRIRNLNVDAKEPRLMGTPGDGPNCPDRPRGLPGHQRLLRGLGDRAKGPGHGCSGGPGHLRHLHHRQGRGLRAGDTHRTG